MTTQPYETRVYYALALDPVCTWALAGWPSAAWITLSSGIR